MAGISRLGGRALAGLLPDLTAAPGPVYLALRDAVTALVLDGRVAPQVRLPSERELAEVLGVSRATVTAAYDALREAGWLTSRTGSGSFVTVPPGARAGGSMARWQAGPAVDDVIDLSCAALAAPPGLIEGVLPAAAAALAEHAGQTGYSPAGLPVLREAIAARFTERGVPTTADQILVTNGAMHAFDLVLSLLVGPGDRVLTELPSYPGAFDLIRHAGARPVVVPLAAAGGWDVSSVLATVRQTAPRLAYLVPDFHNPTGALVDEATRAAVLRGARRAGTTVVVDESFVEVGFTAPGRPSAALDPSVITLGSLSKPIWGGLRVGWVRASAELVQRLAALRTSLDLGGPVLDQLVAAELIPQLAGLMPERVRELRRRRDALVEAVRSRLPGWDVPVPAGGLSLWVQLDAALSTPLSLLAAPAGVVLVPGSRFGVDGTLERFLRLPYVLPEDRLVTAVERIADVWHGLGSNAHVRAAAASGGAAGLVVA